MKERTKEKFMFWLVWKLPRKLIYLASIRLIAKATTGKNSHKCPDEINVMEALKEWDSQKA